MKLDALVAAGERLNRELGREWYLTGAGLKAEPAFQEIYRRHAALQTPDAVACAREAGIPALTEWIVDFHVGQRVAPFEERQLAWEQRAVLRVDGREIPYLRAGIDLQNSPDRAYRIALDRARAAVGAEGLNGMRRDRFATERDVVQALTDRDDYVAAVGGLAGIDLVGLAEGAAALLDDTADLYTGALARLARRRIGVPVGELVRADSAWAFRADEHDAAFPRDRLVATAVGQMGASGSTRRSVRESSRARSAFRLRCPTRSIWCCDRRAGTATTGRSGTSWGTRCTSPRWIRTGRSTSAGSVTIRSPRGSPCCGTTSRWTRAG